MRSPEMSRRWRFEPTSGGGATRSAIPLLIRRFLRKAEEGAPSRGHAFQHEEIVRRHGARQGGVMEIHGVLLAIGDGEPVQEINKRGALCFVGLIFVENDPAIAADRGTVLAGCVDDRKLTRRGADELLGRCLRT